MKAVLSSLIIAGLIALVASCFSSGSSFRDTSSRERSESGSNQKSSGAATSPTQAPNRTSAAQRTPAPTPYLPQEPTRPPLSRATPTPYPWDLLTRTPGPSPSPTPPPTPDLAIETIPSGATVYQDGRRLGETPFYILPYFQSSIHLRFELAGYRPLENTYYFSSIQKLVRQSLTPITGLLKIDTEGPSVQLVMDQTIAVTAGSQAIRIGNHQITASAWGYQERIYDFKIDEGRETSLRIKLDPAPFALVSFTTSPENGRIDPLDTDPASAASFRIRTTGPGQVVWRVIDHQGHVALADQTLVLTGPNQLITWAGTDATGKTLPDGDYEVRFVIGDGTTAITRSVPLRLTRQDNWLSTRSIGSGLSMVPAAEILETKGVQLSTSFVTHGEETLSRTPILIGARVGLGGGVELNPIVGLVGRETADATQYLVGLGARFRLAEAREATSWSGLSLSGFGGFRLYRGTGAVVQVDDRGLNTGLNVGLQFEHQVQAWRLFFDIDWQFSPKAYYQSGLEDQPAALYSWAYLRTGIGFKAKALTGGVSAAIRTAVVGSGKPLFDSTVFLAAELNAVIPDSPLVPGLLAEVYFAGPNDYFISGGLSLGFRL